MPDMPNNNDNNINGDLPPATPAPEQPTPPQPDATPPADVQPNAASPAPAHPKHPPHKHRSPLDLIRRIYALVPILIVLYLSGLALKYLFVSLLVPYQPPPQVTGIPVRLTEAAWRRAPQSWVGNVLAEQPRMPLAHYHRLTGWFQPDNLNDCTQAGCHAPMPHQQRKEDRAFLNMHATSLHCGVCHLKSDDQPLALLWYDLDSGDPTDPPALLQLYGWLESDEGRNLEQTPTLAGQQHLVRGLRAAAQAAGGDPAITRLADAAAAPHYGSIQFQIALAEARTEIPRHFRGEYGAKLALRAPDTNAPLLGHPDTSAAVEEFLAKQAQLDPAARASLLTRVHPLKREQPLACHQCHTAANSLINLAALGYPQQRIAALRQPRIVEMIEHLASGQPLHLPGFIVPQPTESQQPSHPQPSTQPSEQP